MRVLVDADVILSSNLMEGIPHLQSSSVYSHILEHHELPPHRPKKRKASFMHDRDIFLDATNLSRAQNLGQKGLKRRAIEPRADRLERQLCESEDILSDADENCSGDDQMMPYHNRICSSTSSTGRRAT